MLVHDGLCPFAGEEGATALGAALLALLADGITELMGMAGIELPGIKQVFYGVVLLTVVMFLPNGIWPALAKRIGVSR